MGAITPQWFMDLESNMSFETENEYNRLLENMWWTLIGRTKPTTAGREIIAWLLSTAEIYDEGEGGNIRFDDLVSTYTEMSPRFSGAGLELTKAQLTDTDGRGLDLASEWSSQIGAQMAYWPQWQAAQFLMQANDISKYKSYDGKAFFATDHPLNPYKTSAGVYANLFTGAAAGAYPGAVPIDGSDLEVAIANLRKVFAYIAGIKMANGHQPRKLRPRAIVAGPALQFRLSLLTDAKFLNINGGPTDVTGLVRSMGYAPPVMADELAGFEDDRTYFVIAEQITNSRLGGMIYLERDPYAINYYGPQTQAELNRADKWQWHCKGRNAVTAGHPYLIFKCKAV